MSVLAAYWPSLNGPLLWDDKDWFGAMEWNLRGWQGLGRLWVAPTSLQQYYPVTAASFWIDHHLWNSWTFPAHLANVLGHGASAVLFWMLLCRLRVPGAWLAAALFALHPVMVESVAWITERKNVLSTFFALLALLMHGAGTGWWESRWRKKPIVSSLLAWLFFTLALLSKISVAVLPGAVLVIGWWRMGGLRWRSDVLRMVPWLLTALPLVMLVSRAELEMVRGGDWTPPLSFSERLLLAAQLPWTYLLKLLWPAGLCVIEEKWPLHAGQAAGGVLLAALLLLLSWTRQRGALTLVLLFLGALFPVLGLFEVNGMKYAWTADRWVYLSAMAVFTAAGIGLARAPRLLSVPLLAACAWLTWRQAALYGDADVFWQAAIAGNANPWKARNDYGSHLLESGRAEEARQQFEAAWKLHPESASVMTNLALALRELGRHEEALQWLDRALAVHPGKCASIHYAKALVLESLNRFDLAAVSYQTAIEHNPGFSAAHTGLGNLLMMAGRHEEAIACYQAVLALRPADSPALASIGNAHLFMGRHGPALDAFLRALENDPDHLSSLTAAAWIMATTEDERLRDAHRAKDFAVRAAAITHHLDPSVLQVLAAAHAAAEEFDAAVTTAQEGASLAAKNGDAALAGSIKAMLEEYEHRRSRLTPAR